MKFLKYIPKWIRWTVLVLVVAYIALVVYRIPAVSRQDQDAKTVAFIESQHVTLADVMGTNLPSVPYEPQNDATVAGIDQNNNGIRDDVELAIFKEYPNSAKIRAAELQYAMALQLMVTQVNDSDTWKAAANQYSRGDGCMASSTLKAEVNNLVVNTQMRKDAENNAFQFTTSVSIPNTNLCDIDLNSLPN